jgi:hypothetical protein
VQGAGRAGDLRASGPQYSGLSFGGLDDRSTHAGREGRRLWQDRQQPGPRPAWRLGGPRASGGRRGSAGRRRHGRQAPRRPCSDGGSGGRRPNSLRHHGPAGGSTAVAPGWCPPSVGGGGSSAWLAPPTTGARGAAGVPLAGGVSRSRCSSRTCQSRSFLVLNIRPQDTHFTGMGGSSRSIGRRAGCTPRRPSAGRLKRAEARAERESRRNPAGQRPPGSAVGVGRPPTAASPRPPPGRAAASPASGRGGCDRRVASPGRAPAGAWPAAPAVRPSMTGSSIGTRRSGHRPR